MKLNKRSIKLHLLIIAAFNAAVFLPIIGRGFIHDDFLHLYSAAHDSLSHGLTKATGGPFYAPVAWLTFVFDWQVWGYNPYPIAAENLLLHTLNTALLYMFVWRLWQSRAAALWAAAGFALLFPSNTWAVMWISTRAHLLTSVFYLAAMLSMLKFIRQPVGRTYSAAAVIVFAFLAIFSKENGVTLPAALALLMIYEKGLRNKSSTAISTVLTSVIFGSIIVIIGIYLWLRMNSGAVAVSFNNPQGYTYVFSSKVIFSNLLEYFWRTYGLIIILAAGIALTHLISRHRLYFDLLSRNEIFLSIGLFAVTLSPFILLPGRSGIYTYLPGVAAAILLGAAARSLCQVFDVTSVRFKFVQLLPILLIASVYTIFTVGHSLKWIQMAENTTAVLNQIAGHHPNPAPGSFFEIAYTERDRRHRFPDGFAEWGFPSALRLHYLNPTLDGKIVKQGEKSPTKEGASFIRFVYAADENNPPQLVPAGK